MKKNSAKKLPLFVRKDGHLLLFFLGAQVLVLTALLCLVSAQYVELKELSKRVNKESDLLHTVVKTELTPPTLFADSFILYDISTGKILSGKNEYKERPLASLTKLRTAYVYATRNDISQKITIPQLGKNHIYDFLIKPKDVWEATDLLKFMLTISSNDAAETLATLDKEGRDSFIKAMNDPISASSSPLFTTPSGLDEDTKIGGYGTAYDVALMMQKLYEKNPEFLESTTKKTISVTVNKERRSGVPNTNQDVISYPGVLGSKTGFTDKAGGNLAVIFDNSYGKPLIAVVLGSTKEGRFEDMKKIIDFSMKNRELLYQDFK